jgi:hypothetical protein
MQQPVKKKKKKKKNKTFLKNKGDIKKNVFTCGFNVQRKMLMKFNERLPAEIHKLSHKHYCSTYF